MSDRGYSTPIIRYYIDTRPLIPKVPIGRNTRPQLPLLATLPDDIQQGITRFIRIEDKLMSLASALLKYMFIHRTAQVPWTDIRISKTPKPHVRPYWEPSPGWHGNGFEGLEFNVSHQAGIVILAGCRTPDRPSVSAEADKDKISVVAEPKQEQIRVGVDVACAKEPRRTPDFSTQAKLEEWVDTFTEMFGDREREDMKHRPVPNAPHSIHPGESNPMRQVLEQKARRFYTYWALKEAYIKMVGEGLLADWLTQLEFLNVTTPDPGEKLSAFDIGLKTLFGGEDISNSIGVEIEGFDDHFLFAMITRGIAEERSDLAQWASVDIESDIRPCAEGRCFCLD